MYNKIKRNKIMKILRRNKYMNELYSLKNTPDIKIITGVRRCGKSFLMNMFIDEIKQIEPNSNIVRINFNDFENEYLKDYKTLHEYIMTKYVKGKNNYLFIDEIQLCSQFELAINSVHNKMIYDIYLSGSNAFLLSSDLATLFTGRYMEVEVYPFSFQEFKQYFDEDDIYLAFDKYLEYGGFSGSYVYQDNDNKRVDYINNIIDVTILKDIIKRYSVSNEGCLNKIVSYLMDNVSNLTTANGISKYLTSQGFKIDHKTVDNYLNYLCNAFIFYKIKRYDIKGKTYLLTNEKYYLVDNGARIARLGHRNIDYGRIFENIVAIELLRRGYELYVGKLYQNEIDFIALKGNEKLYIQVSDNISDESTLEREIKPLRQIKDQYPKILIANTKSPDYDIEGIHVFNLVSWLLS